MHLYKRSKIESMTHPSYKYLIIKIYIFCFTIRIHSLRSLKRVWQTFSRHNISMFSPFPSQFKNMQVRFIFLSWHWGRVHTCLVQSCLILVMTRQLQKERDEHRYECIGFVGLGHPIGNFMFPCFHEWLMLFLTVAA